MLPILKKENGLKEATLPASSSTSPLLSNGGLAAGWGHAIHCLWTELGKQEHFIRIALKLTNLRNINTPGGKTIPESDTKKFLDCTERGVALDRSGCKRAHISFRSDENVLQLDRGDGSVPHSNMSIITALFKKPIRQNPHILKEVRVFQSNLANVLRGEVSPHLKSKYP